MLHRQQQLAAVFAHQFDDPAQLAIGHQLILVYSPNPFRGAAAGTNSHHPDDDGQRQREPNQEDQAEFDREIVEYVDTDPGSHIRNKAGFRSEFWPDFQLVLRQVTSEA